MKRGSVDTLISAPYSKSGHGRRDVAPDVHFLISPGETMGETFCSRALCLAEILPLR